MKNIYLTIPGVTGSGSEHWQTIWENEFPDKFQRIEQEDWDSPSCIDWIENIEKEVRQHPIKNVVLVAHSLGCLAVAHWAGKFRTQIKGAMLVAPCDVDADIFDYDVTGFKTLQKEKLPFTSLVVASEDDPWMTFEMAEKFAEAGGSEIINVGAKSHISTDSGFGKWDEGLELLKKLDEQIIDKKELKNEYKRTLQPMGVYQIYNSMNEKIFIGASMNLNGILNRNKFQLKMGSHPNRELQKDWNEFVEEDFTFEVLEAIEPREGLDYEKELKSLEILWLEKLQPFGKQGYNIRKKSREERLQMIAANKKVL
jgi:predicted alpha/beta hydrolase family esterase